MKKINAFLFICCYLLLTKEVFSDTVEIDGKTYNCTLHSYKRLNCLDGKKTFIVTGADSEEYVAIVKENSALQIRSVKKVSDAKGVLQYQNAEEDIAYEDSQYNRVAAAELIEKSFKNYNDPLAKQWLKEASALAGKAKELKNKVSIRLRGRSDEINCNRGETRPLKANEIIMQDKYKVTLACTMYSCNSKDPNEKILLTLPLGINAPIEPSVMIMKNGKAVRHNGNFKVYDGTSLALASFPGKKNKINYDEAEELDPKLFIPSKFDENAYKYLSELAGNNYQDEDGLLDMCSTDKKLAPLFAEQNKIAQAMQKQLADTELIEYLKVFNDKIYSFYIDKTKGNRLGCSYQNKIIDDNVLEQFDRLKEISTYSKVSKHLRPEEVQELFKKAKNMKDIPFEYVQDGCYAKAHIMARRFEKMGIQVQKAWIKGKFPIPGSDLFWDYHVAPTIEVKEKNGKIVNYVIDPTIAQKAITLDEWITLVSKKKSGEYVKTTYPFPSNGHTFSRTSVAISNSNVFGPYDIPDASEEVKMKYSQDALRKISDYLAEEGKK